MMPSSRLFAVKQEEELTEVGVGVLIVAGI